jgi:hypothetical protein
MPKKVVSRQAATEDDPKLPYISASMRAVFKKCRYQWHFRYMRRLEPKIAAPPLRFGTLLHTALELYYPKGIKRGPHPARTFEVAYKRELTAATKMGFRDEDGVWHDALALGVDMLEHYVDHYGKDEAWKVLATEAQFEYPVRAVVPGDTWPYAKSEVIGMYTGVLDLVMEERSSGQIWIWDHKGVKSIDTSYLAMDDQSSGYWTYGVDWLREQGVIKPGKDLMGIKFNFLRKATRDDRAKNEKGLYLNKDGSVSKVQPSPFFERFTSYRGESERAFTRERVAAEMLEMKLVKAGDLALLKTPDKMGCKFCDVRDICELHETGSDWQEMMRLIMVPRRPIVREAVEWEHEH